jgi:protein-S-isoprenylcysteine O-methyltransferase Ste14
VVAGAWMTYIVLGLCAYPALALFEYASLHKIPVLKAVMSIVAVILPSVALTAVCLDAAKFSVPDRLSSLGWVLAALSAGLWLYSMFGEIPFAKTYLNVGHGEVLITRGTYALVRHPAVLWFGLFSLGLLLATRSSLLRLAAPIWWLADALYVWGEEKWYLQRVFPGYAAYQRTTPMLLPRLSSLRRCLKTMTHQRDDPEV